MLYEGTLDALPFGTPTILKTMLFWLNHIDQNMTLTPTNNSFLSLSFILCIHPPNTCLILVGVDSPKVIYMTLQINLASAQSNNKCCIVSRLLQKQHLTFSCQFLLTKLSLVSIASLYNNQIKTLIFTGILIFQR
jgi:hypothetical protein